MIRTIDDQEAFPVTVFYNGIYPTKSIPSACNKYPKTPAGIAQNTELLLLLYPRATYAWYKRMTSKLANILLLQDSPKPPSPAPPPVSSTPPPPHNPAHQGHQPSCPEMLAVSQMDNSYAVHMGYPPPMAHGFGYHWPALHHWPALQPMPYQPLPPVQADPSLPAQPQPTRPVPTESAPIKPVPTNPAHDLSWATLPTQSATYTLHRASLHHT